jgi:hypothetical protein
MGLSISVGRLARFIAEGDDEEAVEYARDGIREINRVLAANGLPPHVEPEELPPFHDRCRASGLPYSWIHYLRRAVAYARRAPEEFVPPMSGDPTEDPRVDDELTIFFDSHIICHSDADGFYVPIDFPEPLYYDGGILGSCQGAMRELIQTAPLLGITLVDGQLTDQMADAINAEDGGPLYVERQVWLQLYELFRQSIEQRAAVWFH